MYEQIMERKVLSLLLLLLLLLERGDNFQSSYVHF